ncbi:MAG: hypothetical protein K0R30_2122 [Ornithinibacter sp.]|jgi:hypothetical protein|nr:hypothetical protein [Ornithinibacter sp.]
MAKRSIHGYVELASGLGELTRSRAKEAARELLTLSGADASSKKVAKQASQLAEDLLTAAETNRKQLVRLVRREVDSAMGRLDVSRLVGDVQHLGATVTSLAGQVDELARAASGRGTLGSPTRSSDAVTPAVQLVRDTTSGAGDVVTTAAENALAASNSTARRASGRPATARKSPAKRGSTTKTAARGATSRASTQSPAKKSTAKTSTATKAATKKTTAKKTTAKKTTAKKATPTKATARKSTGQTSASSGSSRAARKAPAKKAPLTRAPATKATSSTRADGGGGSSSPSAAGPASVAPGTATTSRSSDT